MFNAASGRFWILFPHPLPIKTFPKRLTQKWIYLLTCFISFLKISFGVLGSTLGLSGAKIIGTNSNGNTILGLIKNCSLGLKGSTIELPRDRVIFKYVRRTGSWELKESKFLAGGLEKLKNEQETSTVLLDIGANTGLITLQAMNISKAENDIILFEPIPRHVDAIRHNLRNLKKIEVNNFALSDRNGRSKIFTQTSNHGNTSLLKSVVPFVGQFETEIELKDTQEYCASLVNRYDNFVIKSDTQGMDALILSRIPIRIWQNVYCAMIEVWALPGVIESDVDNLLNMLDGFDSVSWLPNSKVSVPLREVRNFWLSKSNDARNLFLIKTR